MFFIWSVQDVDWHPTNENMFASVGDDKMLNMCGIGSLSGSEVMD